MVKHSSPKGRFRVRVAASPHMEIVESAGGVVINGKGQVIVVRQKNKFVPWSLPKGHVEKGEDFLVAALREIKEETGISDLHLVKELPIYERPIKDKNGIDGRDIKRFHLYLFTTKITELRPIDKDNPEAIWVDKDKVAAMFTHEKDRAYFESILEQIH